MVPSIGKSVCTMLMITRNTVQVLWRWSPYLAWPRIISVMVFVVSCHTQEMLDHFEVFVTIPGLTPEDAVYAEVENGNLMINGQKSMLGKANGQGQVSVLKLHPGWIHITYDWPSHVTWAVDLDVRFSCIMYCTNHSGSCDPKMGYCSWCSKCVGLDPELRLSPVYTIKHKLQVSNVSVWLCCIAFLFHNSDVYFRSSKQQEVKQMEPTMLSEHIWKDYHNTHYSLTAKVCRCRNK